MIPLTNNVANPLPSSTMGWNSDMIIFLINNGTLNNNITLNQTERILSSVSQVSGILSLSVWLFAQLPQIIENHLNESVSGVSLAFLCCWIGGDTTNLIGCILTKALPFQTLLATYYCFIDCILSLQYWYYTRIYPQQKIHHNLLQSPNMLRPIGSRKSNSNSKHVHTRRNRFEQDITRSPMEITNSHYNVGNHNKGSFIQRILGASFVGSLTKPVNGLPIEAVNSTSTSTSTSNSNSLHNFTKEFSNQLKKILIIISSIHIQKFRYSSEDIGQISAWVCSFLYLSSRAPQIFKNHNSKSTRGISAYLFLFAMLGNLFYTISIVSDLYLISMHQSYYESDPNDSQYNKILTDQLPFIVGSSGTVIFDCIILFQCWYFAEQSSSRNSSVSSYGENFGYGSLYEQDEEFEHHHHRHHNNNNNSSNHNHHHHGRYKSRNRSRTQSRPRNSKRKPRKNSVSEYRSDSPGHFQKPDWYTTTEPNYPSIDETAAFSPNNLHQYDNSSNGGGMNRAIPGSIAGPSYDYLMRTPPPAHYISASHSRSIINQGNSHQQSGLLSSTINAITKSLSYKNENPYWQVIKSPRSSHSGSYDQSQHHNNNNNMIHGSSPLPTSLIPSIIGNFSSVSKKMSHDSKVPFSPIDFLADDFHRPVEGSFSTNGGTGSSSFPHS
ncbi:uncharacterized protein RJT21DRAFT_46539 [Scheffersomyces amazonensis]|uniref:uncharacterized protein n=1 Tax=Scheffersomyces amazonensis TaxID=1078765 RepID=UPI00315D353C